MPWTLWPKKKPDLKAAALLAAESDEPVVQEDFDLSTLGQVDIDLPSPPPAPGTEAASPQKKEKIQMWSRRNARSAAASMTGILARKIYVTPERGQTLHAICAALPTTLTAPAGSTEAESTSSAGAQVTANVSSSSPSGKGLPAGELHPGFPPALLVNVSDALAERLEASLRPLGYVFRRQTLPQGHWVALMKSTGDKFLVPGGFSLLPGPPAPEPAEPVAGKAASQASTSKMADPAGASPQVVIVALSGPELTEFDRCTLAVHWMACRVVLALTDPDSAAPQQLRKVKPSSENAGARKAAADAAGEAMSVHASVEQVMGGTWPVFDSPTALEEYCRDKVPFILHMRAAIRADVYSRIEKWGHINKIWHGAKRAPFALIPFAIAGVNLVGMTRLVGRVLLATGMTRDRQAQAAASKKAASAWGQTYIIDGAGDAYQFLVSSAVMLEVTTAFWAGGVDAALGTLTLVDVFLLGSVTIVTSVLSSIGAAITRPYMVSSLANLVGTLQVIWLQFPATRRGEDEHDPEVNEDVMAQAQQINSLAFDTAEEEAVAKQSLK